MSIKPLAYIPETRLDIPERVALLAGNNPIEPVWVNGVGGVTFRIGDETGLATRFVKYAVAGTPESDFEREATKMAWVGKFSLVPQVLEVGQDEAGSWLMTRALPGSSAVDPRWIARPEIAARAIGAGLRTLHDALPVAGCEFSWSVSERLKGFEQRISTGETPDSWSKEYAHLSIAEARELLSQPPEIQKLVVCHGDACAPNTLLDDEGNFAGHVDLGEVGVGDRWADLAIAAWSTEWNYGPGYEGFVYQGYGVVPDQVRIAYYKMLWDLS
ncbi:aminoglycoside phosphotransferase APH(3') [Arthrobacter sp. MYb227]|uniref:aminoglycoside 3'-phosphotransferase n=1 Tax=Arthrobacter sp. MYb227 TaxID=1848601 RepID=UPI000CFDD280|nr:aminoglycoside 3'-phosphotransferase [Arthrobacter sp. MYb227]PQZ95110.1 aminoglycoside phosphotransferase APH(3') [Arthrobacter sp. MYb227]